MSLLPVQLGFLLLLVSALAACRAPQGGGLSLSGCILDPRPRPSPPPPDADGFLAASVSPYPYLELNYLQLAAQENAASFSFALAQGESLALGPYRMADDDPDGYDLNEGSFTVTLFRDGNQVYLRVDRGDHVWPTRNGQQRLLNRWDTAFETNSLLQDPHLVRMSPVSLSGTATAAVGVEMNVFGVDTGFTLLGNHLRLGTVSDFGPAERLVRLRPGGQDEEHYHALEYWKSESGSIRFWLLEGEHYYVAPLGQPTLAKQLTSGRNELALSYREQPVRRVELSFGKQRLVSGHVGTLDGRTQDPKVRLRLAGTVPSLNPKIAPGPWAVLAVEVEAFGALTGFLLIGPKIKLQPSWSLVD